MSTADDPTIARALEIVPLARVGLRLSGAFGGNAMLPGRWIADGYVLIDTEAFGLPLHKLPTGPGPAYIPQDRISNLLAIYDALVWEVPYTILGARIPDAPGLSRWERERQDRIAYLVPDKSDGPIVVAVADQIKLLARYLTYDSLTVAVNHPEANRRAILFRRDRVPVALLQPFAPLASDQVAIDLKAALKRLREIAEVAAKSRPAPRYCASCSRHLTTP